MITAVQRITGKVSGSAKIIGNINGAVGMVGKIGVGDIKAYDIPEYTGDYTVTPMVGDAQTLSTKGFSMREDVVVHAVPEYEVSNLYGTTFVIGV